MTTLNSSLIADCRDQFPALGRRLKDEPVVFFDGPAGTQVPRVVIQAISRYLSECNANLGGRFVTSDETVAWMNDVHQAAADLMNASDPAEIAFGANMTSLTFAVSRALAQTWSPGDEIAVTRMEHDANFTPWVLAARDAGVQVKYASILPETCTLDLDDLRRKITERTRLVAVGCASNAVGTRNPVGQICAWAREVNAISFLDAVHFAPHDLIDVQSLNCDLLVCSAYKFFGPHVGMLWGRRHLLESLQPYKLRPAPDRLPGRWMTGTQNHEGMAGTMAAIDYLADLGRRIRGTPNSKRRDALEAAFQAIRQYESDLIWKLIDGLRAVPGVTIYGLTDPASRHDRMPTVAWNHPTLTSSQVAQRLGEAGIFVWHGNYYALPLTEALGVEPDGMVRVGLVHYNTEAEVTRFLEAVHRLPH